jgi:anti-sigma factor RsiW
MSCNEVRDLLALYAGGETYPQEREEVETHLRACAACARELDAYRELRSNLGSLRDGEPPSGTWKALWTGVRGELFAPMPSRFRTQAVRASRYAAVLLIGVAMGLGGYMTGRGLPGGSSGAGPTSPLGDEVATGRREPGPVRPVTIQEPQGLPEIRFEHRFLLPPAAAPDARGYLPRVEDLPRSGQKDF